MDAFRCLRLSVLVQARDNIQLPSYQGSVIRGAFGNALRGIVCAVRNQDCSDCLLKDKCVYSYAFETAPPSNSKVLRKHTSVPRPFVLTPVTGKGGVYEPGMTFGFQMTLVGRATKHLPYFVYAFMQMGEKGLGRGRGRFRTEKITVSDEEGRVVETVYEKEVLRAAKTLLSFDHARELAKTYSPDEITLKFLTPVRIRYQEKLCDNLQFHILIRNLARRLSNLLYFHCNQESGLLFKEIIDKAKSVNLTRRQIRWYDWTRYSGRQKKQVKMGGVIGEVTYKGDIGEFLPMLVAGSWVNIGKGTAFGLGRFDLVRKDV